MPETDYLRVPADRVGALIGTKGETKQLIENATNTHLDIDSEECTVAIYPNENMEDPLGVWKANHIVKAIARGFNPRVALKLNKDDTYLEIIKLPLYVAITTPSSSTLMSSSGSSSPLLEMYFSLI